MAAPESEYPVKLTATWVSDTENLRTTSNAGPRIQGQGTSARGIQDTPVKAAQVTALCESTLSHLGNESIYKSLGWDDDDDDELI